MWLGLRLGASVSRGTAPLPRAPLRHPGSGCSHSWSMPLYMRFQALDLSPLHSYILFSSPPEALPSFPFCVFSVRTGYEPGALKKTKELLVSLDAIRVGQDRDSHIRVLYLILKKFYLIYLFLTNTILNLYLSVVAPKFCLGGT